MPLPTYDLRPTDIHKSINLERVLRLFLHYNNKNTNYTITYTLPNYNITTEKELNLLIEYRGAGQALTSLTYEGSLNFLLLVIEAEKTNQGAI